MAHPQKEERSCAVRNQQQLCIRRRAGGKQEHKTQPLIQPREISLPLYPITAGSLWTFWAERLFREQKQHSSFRSSLHSQVTCRALVLVTLRGELAFLSWVWACKTSAQPGWWAVPSQAEGMRGSWRLYRTQNKQAQRYICKVWPRVSLLTPIRLMGTSTRRYSLCWPGLGSFG